MADRKNPVILIVDDDEQVLKSLKIWLKNEGFKALTATNGDGALEIVSQNDIDVALVDFRMKKEDGIMVAQRLNEADPMIKVIMLTGFPSYETAVEAMKVGIFDYLSKGSSNEKILDTIHNAILEREREHNLNPHESITTNKIRLILFCNHFLLKEQLENLSKSNPTFQLTNTFPSLDYLGVKSVSQYADIALICANCSIKDLHEVNQLIPKLYRSFPEIKPIIINETFTDKEKFELLKLGIRGFFSQELNSGDLEKALLRVNKGEIWVSRSVINLSLQWMATYKTPYTFNNENQYGLTDREIEILRTMALGLRNKEIADKLYISEKTVKTHINRVFKKLGVSSRAKAILKAVENQII